MVAMSPIAWCQETGNQSVPALDLSAQNVPEVPAAVNETASAPPTTAAQDANSSGIVEESVTDVPKTDSALPAEKLPGGKLPGAKLPGGKLPGLKFPGGNSFGLGFPAADAEPMTLVAEYNDLGGGKGQLLITATMDGNWHTYSTTQPPGGPKPSKISASTPGVKLTGRITSDQEPEVRQVPEYSVPVEEHHQRVVWKSAFEYTDAFKPGQTELKVNYDGLVCDNACREVRQTLVAKFVSAATPVDQPEFRSKNTHATFTARLEPAEAKPGSEAALIIKVKCDPGYHVYSFVPGDKDPKFKTLIVPTQKGDLKWGEPIASQEPHVDNSQGMDLLWHEGEFEWKLPLQIPSEVAHGPQTLEVALMYLTCNESSCDAPAGLIARGVLNIVPSPGATPFAPMELSSPESPKFAAGQANVASWIDFKSEPKSSLEGSTAKAQATGGLKTGQLSFMTILFALAGGFILNFMPCVLPVIGLKVLGFVEQAGSDRSEVIRLNLAYVLGICVVMWTLAGITIGMQQAFGQSFGWGQQFTIFEFKLAMASLVFAMALSFLGVWEIPIPGFATSYKSNQLMQREGMFGAFAKGIFTTILATPCSGPFLGVVFAVTATLDSLGVIVVYTMVGLGMGLPFIALCLKPDAIKFLPKPGNWMETLKEGLSFPLLLTVVYFVAAIGSDYRVATFSTLIAVWFACWLIGKVPVYADYHVKVKTWSAAIAVAVVWGMVSFSWLGPHKTDMPWEPYSASRLSELRKQGKTVMIDFTANWCLNCQANTKFSIDVPQVVELVKENGVATMLADKTEPSPQIDEKLLELRGTVVIPFLVIYPADPKADPIILNDVFTKDQLLKALKSAGPSQSGGETKLTSLKSN